MGELERSRQEFEARVRAARRPAPAAEASGGSPPALLAIGVVGSLVLGACALALGGGLLLVPAATPLVTVLAVLASRALARR